MQQSPFDLTGKTIVVTGASSGIGQQCAVSLSEQGAKIIAIGRNEERLSETIAQLNKNSDHLKYSLDLTDYEKVTQWFNDAKEAFGTVDGVVNAAGISPTIPFRAVSPEKMQEAFNINVIAAMNFTKLLCKPSTINKEGASIIFISSVMGNYGEMGKSLYGMTKGALTAGIKSLALEYAPKKIRFNSISPAVVISPMSMSSVYSKDPEALERVKSYHPLGLGEPIDVANATTFLLSPASRWITGTNLIIDGGYTCK